MLDLVKQYEKRPRESLVGKEFKSAVEVLNECIDPEHKIRYIALDYSKITSISKGKHKGKDGKNAAAAKKNAMAAVGNEWAMMETSLAANANNGSPADVKKPGAGAVGGGVSAGGSSSSSAGASSSTGGITAGGSTHTTSALMSAAGGVGVPTGKDADDGKEGGTGGGVGPAPESVQTPDSKIDVLRELEDIALVSLTETQYFCK